jgi:hypothetical protein
MSRRITPSLLSLLAIAVGGALHTPAADAQSIDRNRIFDITIEAAGQIYGVSIREGEPLRLTLFETQRYEVSPVLPGGRGEEVLVAISRGSTADGGGTEIIERMRIRQGVPASMRNPPNIRLVLDRIRYATPGGGPAQPRTISFSLPGRAAADQCCVCCSGGCACACGVVAECGHCCVNECCGMIHPTSGSDEDADRARSLRIARLLGRNTCEQNFPEVVARLASRR